MRKIVNIRKASEMTPERLIRLSKDKNTVYAMFNLGYRMFDYYIRVGLETPDYKECWKVKPLYKVLEHVDPERYCVHVRSGAINLFRIEMIIE